MHVRAATSRDLDELVALARRSFFDAYSETDDHEVIEGYCARAFTSERFESILADLRATLLIARDAESGALAGYAHVGDSHPPECVVGPRPIELARLYLAREWIGRGVGSILMREAVQAARQLGGRTLWLGVYERNPRAMAFYGRFGMKVVGTKPGEWGGEVFQDPVMTCSI